MSKEEQEPQERPRRTNFTAQPPVKRKGLLLASAIMLGVWLIVLVSLAVYSVS
ncbi:MAG: hypothetical protein MPJ50_05130 [Pirellulales bacterium]|nr:hypothetical protein [Pirellulales bacterium]